MLPRRLKREFANHEVSTVDDAGFKGLTNGKLIQVAAGNFDVLITVDRNLAREHVIANFDIALVVLIAQSNRYEDLKPLVPATTHALDSIVAGEVVELTTS